jgi:hypothetical protein
VRRRPALPPAGPAKKKVSTSCDRNFKVLKNLFLINFSFSLHHKASIARTMAALLDSPGFKTLSKRPIVDLGTFAVTASFGSSGDGEPCSHSIVFPFFAGIVLSLIVVVLL